MVETTGYNFPDPHGDPPEVQLGGIEPFGFGPDGRCVGEILQRHNIARINCICGWSSRRYLPDHDPARTLAQHQETCTDAINWRGSRQVWETR